MALRSPRRCGYTPGVSTLALRGAHVWDGVADSPCEVSAVFDDEHVAALGSDAGADESLDVSGCTVIPGLIDAHAHLCFNAASDWRAVYDSDSPGRMLLRMAAAGRSMLEAGITTVRDVGAPTPLALELRQAFADGLAGGPHLLVSGAPVTTTGGHCWFMGGEADGEVELRKAVRSRVKAGVDCIKIMASGGNMTRRTNTFAPQYSVEELRVVVEECQRLRIPLTAHAHGTEGIRAAVEAGVPMIEHCSFSRPGGIDLDELLIARMADQGTVVSPTVSVGYLNWPDDGLRQRRGEVLRAMIARGIQLVMSTDCGIPGVPHKALAGGMQVLCGLAGLTPLETLRLATRTSAATLGLKDRGTLEPGQLADVVVVDGDPTRDLRALERVRCVFKAGALVYERSDETQRRREAEDLSSAVPPPR